MKTTIRKSLSIIAGGLGVCTFLTSVQSASADAIAQWRFDEAPGDTIAIDSVGGQDGTLVGSAAFVAGGISGNAISVTIAGNGVVNMGDAFDFSSGDFSIVAWLQTTPGDQTPDYVLLARHRATISSGYLLGVNQNGPYGQTDKAWFYQSTSPGGDLVSNDIVNDGQWHQVVVSYRSGGIVEMYVDGTPLDNSRASNPIEFIDASFMVGGIDVGGAPTSHFNGLVDEVQLYDHALRPCEVQFLYENPGEIAPPLDSCPEDVNDDGTVDVLDLLAVLAAWGPCDECPANVNCDLVVDILDLLAVLAAWGPC